jgi:hypothetical protein
MERSARISGGKILRNGMAQWKAMCGRCCRLAIAFTFIVMCLVAPGRANANPGVTVFPGMQIHQGG